MRILASGKRDSVTGEEVDVAALAQAVGSTGQYSSSRNSISLSVGLGTAGGFVDSSGKLVTDHVLRTSKSTHKGKFSKKDSRIKSKKKESARRSIKLSATAWKCRVGKGVTSLIDIVNCRYYYCCCARNNNGRSEGGEEDCYDNKKAAGNKGGCRVIIPEGKFSPKKVSKEKVDEGNNKTTTTTDENKQTSSAASRRCSAKEISPTIQAKTSGRKSSNNNNYYSIIIALPSGNIDDTNIGATTCTGFVTLAASGTTDIKTMRGAIYHEKQVKSLCALHALNNLLQDGRAFQQEDLDKICGELDPNSWVNPHKSVFGLGNYDINVIMTALQQKKLEAIWFDKRKDPSEELNFENIYGFILNIPSDCKLGWLALPIKRKHWVAIRNLPSPSESQAGRNNFYNLDSKFDKPESIGSKENLIEYLRSELKSPEKELFLVVTEDVGRLETWRKNPPPPLVPTTAGSSSPAPTGASSNAINSTNLLPVPNASGDGLDASAGSGTNRRTSNDSGVVDLLPDLRDINVVDLNKEDLMRRQSSGVWSDMT